MSNNVNDDFKGSTMRSIKIFNLPQARMFLQHGCEVVDFSVGKKMKVGIVFKRDEQLEILLKRWHNKEFNYNDFKERF